MLTSPASYTSILYVWSRAAKVLATMRSLACTKISRAVHYALLQMTWSFRRYCGKLATCQSIEPYTKYLKAYHLFEMSVSSLIRAYHKINICVGYVFSPCIVMQYSVSFLALPSSCFHEDRTGCFTLILSMIDVL